MAKITIELEECIGCGSCSAMCEKYWEVTDDMKAHIKGGKKVGKNEELEIDSIECNMEAAESCPVNCIHIYVDDEKKI